MPKRTPNVVVSVSNDIVTDQRVHKICTYLKEKNANVLLIGRRRKKSLNMDNRSYQVKRMRLPFENGPLFYASLNIYLFFNLLFKKKLDILVSNDLDTLLANFLIAKIRRKELIYDSHEYFLGVPEIQNRRLVKLVWKSIEAAMFPKLSRVMTVNDSIAKMYEKEYHILPDVVRNISPKQHLKRSKERIELGIPEGKFVAILQGAGINVDRGAEEAVESMLHTDDDIVLLIVGDGDVVPQLKEFVKKEKLSNKVFFFGRMPYQEMMQYTFNSNVGLTLDKPLNLNYEFSLPNKVFDYLRAGIPVIASNLIEVTKIVKKNGAGIILENHSPNSIATALNSLKDRNSLYQECQQNALKAAELYTWENEVKQLNKVYEGLLE